MHNNSLLLMVAAAVISSTLTAITIRVCHRQGWLARPRSDRWHREPVAQFGGIAIIIAVVLLTIAMRIHDRLQYLVFLTAAIGIVGLLDDVRSWRPAVKLLVQFSLAAIAVACGIVYPLRTAEWINVLFTIVWIVGITNAVNLLDNMDGLAGGVGIIAAVTLALLMPGQPLALVTLIMAGAIAGFLVFNTSPAKIFMGDTGSLAIGFFLAGASVLGTEHISTLSSIIFVPSLVLFLPIFDTALVIVTRRLNGRAVSAGARDHTSHRLVLLGMTDRVAVVTLYVTAAASGLVAVVSNRLWPQIGPGLIGTFLVAATLLWLHLAKLTVPEEYLSQSRVFTFEIPAKLRSVASKAAMLAMDAALVMLALYLAILLRFDVLSAEQVNCFLLASTFAVAIKVSMLALFGRYRHEWSIKSFRDAYPVVAANVIGSLVLVTVLTFNSRLQDLSRAVFVVDFFLTTSLMLVARASHRVFDDVLSGAADESCLLLGGASVQFFRGYFGQQRSRTRLVAAICDPNTVLPGSAEAFERLDEIASLVRAGKISSIYMTPDCSEGTKRYVAELCARTGIKRYQFDFKVRQMADGTNRIPFYMLTHLRGETLEGVQEYQ